MVFYDSSWGRLKNKKIQNGKSEQLFLPYSYRGFVNVKSKGKIIKRIPTQKSKDSKYAGPLLYSSSNFKDFVLGRKNNSKEEINISSQEEMKKTVTKLMNENKYNKVLQDASDNRLDGYLIEIKDYPGIEEKIYTSVDFLNMEAKSCRHFIFEILASFNFDAKYFPAGAYAAENFWYSRENRKLVLTTILIPLMEGRDKNGKLHQLKFYLKRSKTGKLLLIFQGRAVWKKYMNLTTISVNNKKVTMIGGIYELAHDLKSNLQTSPIVGAIKTSGKIITTAVKGSPFGLFLVAAADTLEWILNDNPDKKLSELFGQIIIDFSKALVAGLAAVIVGVAAVILGGSALVVIAAGAIAMLAASFYLEKADAAGLGTSGVPWAQISKDQTEAIWETIRQKIIKISVENTSKISNENQEFKFEPII
ncbi:MULTISPECIES: hypothetical protein [unclassified Acinetobacter]|uniref:hypothetical protein n=2 Tax=unclassified Acinetobacter TaxID=196816 RepID=UPI0015D323B5|nr:MULTISPECIES: hypothetical protein [unclassified Acinetobacter]